MNLNQLRAYVETATAVSRVQRLQPVDGPGGKIFPSTYPADKEDSSPIHVIETRRVGGQYVSCVLIDSVQSQANRIEAALQEAIDSAMIKVPHLELDFRPAGLTEIGRGGLLSSLELPHRCYDAAFRDSTHEGIPFMESVIGLELSAASPANALPLLRYDPLVLEFGGWQSQAMTSENGLTGAKFARAIVSEVIGVNVPVEDTVDARGAIRGRRTAGRRTGSRSDPLGILRRVPVYIGKTNWSDKEGEAGPGAVRERPSKINHGQIAPNVEALGVTMDYAIHSQVLTFARLRQLRFGTDRAKNLAGHTYLAALGLLGPLLADLKGRDFRSRCCLVGDGQSAPHEVIAHDGKTTKIELDLPTALALYEAALHHALEVGIELRVEPTPLYPQEKLVSLIKQSRERALVAEDDLDRAEG